MGRQEDRQEDRQEPIQEDRVQIERRRQDYRQEEGEIRQADGEGRGEMKTDRKKIGRETEREERKTD